MSIRLSKACKDLNVGLSTAIEFLAKKGHKLSADPNLKLSDDLHLLLAKEFNKDMALKMESERLSQERHLKEKAGTVALEGYIQAKPVEKPVETIKTTIPKDQMPHIKAVGHIDLDAINKPSEHKKEQIKGTPVQETKTEVTSTPSAPAPEKVIEKVVEEVKPVVAKEEVKPAPVAPKAVEVVVLETKPEPVAVIEKPVEKPKAEFTEKTKAEKTEPKVEVKQPEKPAVKVQPEVEEVTEPEEDEIFTLSRPVMEKGPVVVGTIDLNLLNQSTRPKPKTKEQKKKEREEKGKQQADTKKVITAADAAANKKKKRERFTNQKVDINKVQQQTGSTIAQPKKAVPGQNNTKTSKDKTRKPLKTVVNEEEVQKQIKETLARLAGGNKKGKCPFIS